MRDITDPLDGVDALAALAEHERTIARLESTRVPDPAAFFNFVAKRASQFGDDDPIGKLVNSEMLRLFLYGHLHAQKNGARSFRRLLWKAVETGCLTQEELDGLQAASGFLYVSDRGLRRARAIAAARLAQPGGARRS